MRSQMKVTGGKFVCIQITRDEKRPAQVGSVVISGDFFLHPEESIGPLERSLAGVALDSPEAAIVSVLEASLKKSNAMLIGVSALDIARLFVMAVSA